MSEKSLAAKMQREDVEQRPYLFTRAPDGRWQKNLHGTVLNPVWVDCSPLEHELLEQRALKG